MNTAILVTLAVVLGLLVILWLARRQHSLRQARFERAVAEFSTQAGLSETFLAAANATGKPRGLRWTRCDFNGKPLFVTHSTTGELLAFAGAAIGFQAIPGGDMEDVEAVGDIRYATLIFIYRDGAWQTDGRAVFNLEPAQALERIEASGGR